MKAELVGIVNVTPDSFSDGGAALVPEDALARARQCFESGARVVDIGAQSTRPGAEFLSARSEWGRLEEVLPEAIKIARACGGKISLDTFHPEIAARALALGVDWINDVMGFEHPAMIEAVKTSDCSLVLMHSLGVPPNTAFTIPQEDDSVAYVMEYFKRRADALDSAGIAADRLIFDPGIGFGKTPVQSLALLLRAQEMNTLGSVLIGHSRKSFLKLFTAAPAEARDELTLAFSSMLAAQQVRYLRVHNVLRHAALLAAMDAKLPHS